MAGHQTIRLIRGRHSSPERGACVMEVASMLAGEQFTDEPECVCPVIAEFLRTYNDEVDNDRRQDLYAYAALVVGTRGTSRDERRHANVVLDWWLERTPSRLPTVRRLIWKAPPATAARDIEIAYRAAHWAAARPERHAEALALIESLAGRSPLAAPPIPPTEAAPRARDLASA